MINFIKNLFLRNWGLKLFSFLLAFILWLTLIPEEKTFLEKTISIPLELHNIPPNIELVEKPPSSVDVRIRAPQSIIGQISPANVHLVLDLRQADVQQSEYPLTKNMVSLPPGVELKDIHPSQISLKLEQSKEVMLEVKPNLIGNPPEGFILEKVEVIPPKIPIRGPESRFQKNYKVSTTPVVLSNITESIEREVTPIPPNPDLRIASTKTTVLVRLLIKKEENNSQPSSKIRKKGSLPS